MATKTLHTKSAMFLFAIWPEKKFILRIFRVEESSLNQRQSCISWKVGLEECCLFFWFCPVQPCSWHIFLLIHHERVDYQLNLDHGHEKFIINFHVLVFSWSSGRTVHCKLQFYWSQVQMLVETDHVIFFRGDVFAVQSAQVQQ